MFGKAKQAKGRSDVTIKPTYTTREVLEILKITSRTLSRYIKQGQIKCIKIGREYRFTEEALQDFLEHGTEKKYLSK